MRVNGVARVAGMVLVGAMVASACSSSGSTAAPASAAPPASAAAPSVAPASGGAPASGAAGAVTLGVAFPNSDTFLSRVQNAHQGRGDGQGRHRHDHRRQGRHRNPAEPGRELRLAGRLGDHRGPGRHQRRAADGGRRQGREHPDRVRQPRSRRSKAFRTSAPTPCSRAPSRWRSSPSSPAARATSSSSRARSPTRPPCLRTQGCNDVVGKNPGMKVVATQAGDWDRAKGQSITENWIQSGILKAGMVVCANNDEMALGAINALKAGNLLDTVFVGGVDATSEALAAMQAGDLEVTVFQDAEGPGRGRRRRGRRPRRRQDRPRQPRRHPVRARHAGEHAAVPRRQLAPTRARRPAPPVDATTRVLPFGGPARWASEHRIRPRFTRSFRRPRTGRPGAP